MTQFFAIQNARIFDGSNILPQGTVLVQDGTITVVSSNVKCPSDAQVIDGTDCTLLPGFIDSHTHTFGPALKQALIFGVTTELDMFTDHRMAKEIKQQRAS
jgi:imidazolonepropionase-like amidohydrolase